MKTGYTDAAGYCLVASAARDMPERQAPPAQRGAGHGLARGARQREPEAAELGLPGLRRGAPVRGRQADRHRPVWKGTSAEAKLGAPRRAVRQRAQGRGRQAEDRRSSAPTRWSRRWPRASASGTHQGQHRRRHAGGRGAAGGAASRSSRPASSAAPGTRSGCGSSKLRMRNRCTEERPPCPARCPTRLCYLNGEYTRAVRRQGVACSTAASSSATASTRWCRCTASALFRFDEHMARLQRGLGKLRIANPHDREDWLERCRHLVRALAAADRRARPAGLHPGHARRGAARPCDAGGHRADGVHDGQRR